MTPTYLRLVRVFSTMHRHLSWAFRVGPIVGMVIMMMFHFGAISTQAQIYEPEGINMPGEWNGWTNSNDSATMGDFRMSKRALGGGHYVTTLEIGASGDASAGSYGMLFTSGPTTNQYANKWAGATLATDAISTLTYNTGADNAITLTDGHYTFIFKDSGYGNSSAAVLKTTSVPVVISEVSGVPTEPVAPDVPTTITVTLSAVPSPEENVYIRYSTDDWVTSQAVTVSGFTGSTAGTAEIPGQPANTTVRFYVLTTTVDSTNWGSDIDLLTLTHLDDGGQPFAFSTPLSSTPETTQNGPWSDPATWATGVVPGSADSVIIAHAVTVQDDLTHSAKIRISAGATLSVSTGATLTAQTFQVQGSLTVSTGATLAASSGATLDGGTLTIDGTLLNLGGVTGTGTFNVNGTFQLLPGGYAALSPTYGAGSTLVYNTGGTYGRYNEWNAASGAGHPHHMTLSGNTTLQLSNDVTDVQRSLAGTLTIESGSTLTLNDPSMTQPLLAMGDVINQGALTLSDSLGGDLKIAGSFTQSGSFTPNQRGVFMVGEAGQSITTSTPLTLPYLFIDNTSPAESVTLDGSVTVTELLNLGDGDLQTGGTLTLASDALFTAADGATVSGTATFEREISGTAGWRLLSFPVPTGTAADLSDDTAVQGVPGSENPGFSPNVLTYGVAGQFAAPSDASSAIQAGFGVYFYNNAEAGSSALPLTLDVTGTPDFSARTYDLNTTQVYPEGVGSYFTLLGNPYPTAYDLSQLVPVSGSGIQDNVTLWNGSTYVTADRTTGYRVAPWQGFWVESVPSGDQTSQLTFQTGGIAGERPSALYFGKGTGDERRGDLHFTLLSDSTRDEAIRFALREYATPGYDRADATKQAPLLSRYATLSFLDADGRLKSVESRSFELPEQIQIPLKRQFIGVSGTFTLSWSGLESMPEDWTLEFVDHRAETAVNLRNASSYTFQSEATGAASDSTSESSATRFTLRITPEATSVGTGPDSPSPLPTGFGLQPNYPNPFNPATTLRFTLDRPAPVELAIYSSLGHRVATLLQEHRPAGSHSLIWDASSLASGIYYARLQSDGRMSSIRLTLLK